MFPLITPSNLKSPLLLFGKSRVNSPVFFFAQIRCTYSHDNKEVSCLTTAYVETSVLLKKKSAQGILNLRRRDKLW